MASPRKTFKNLSSAEKTFIAEKRDVLTIDQLAHEVGTTETVIKKVLDQVTPAPAPPATPSPETQTIKAEETATGTVASLHTPIVREEDGITVMTGGASQWADEIMKKQKGPNYVDANRERIFKPRPNKPSR